MCAGAAVVTTAVTATRVVMGSDSGAVWFADLPAGFGNRSSAFKLWRLSRRLPPSNDHRRGPEIDDLVEEPDPPGSRLQRR